MPLFFTPGARGDTPPSLRRLSRVPLALLLFKDEGAVNGLPIESAPFTFAVSVLPSLEIVP